jgi:hypothetical protein
MIVELEDAAELKFVSLGVFGVLGGEGSFWISPLVTPLVKELRV